MDLVRAFIGPDGLEIVGVPERRVIQCDAVAAEDGARLSADRDGLASVVEHADADLMRLEAAGIFESA